MAFRYRQKISKEQKVYNLANDLAIEITVGGDRFDRDDLFSFLRGAGAEVGDLAVLRSQTLELAKDMQPDGHSEKSVEFFNRQLDYWLDPKAFGESLENGMDKHDIEDFSNVIVQRVVNGQAEGYGHFDRSFFHQMLVSLGAMPNDMAKLYDAAKEKAGDFHDGMEPLEDFNSRIGRSLAWWLDKKVFEDNRNSLLKEAGSAQKNVSVENDKKVSDKKVAGLSV